MPHVAADVFRYGIEKGRFGHFHFLDGSDFVDSAVFMTISVRHYYKKCHTHIRIVANKKFIAKNPAAKKFFEVFTLPLADINEQNTRMYEGEKSQKDIDRHVNEWIAKNMEKWEGWLKEARKAAK